MPDDQTAAAPPRKRAVRAIHAASLLVHRARGGGTEVLMGMRGNKHKFMPNRLVFPGGRVDRADLTAQPGAPLAPHTERNLRRSANPDLARGLGIAAARELEEETGLVLADAPGAAPRLDRLWYLARAVTPPTNPIRYNARFLTAHADGTSGDIGGDGELDGLRFYGLDEAMALDLALPTRRVLERFLIWLGMSEQQRIDQTQVPVLKKDRGWLME